jgi:hypothetical protein
MENSAMKKMTTWKNMQLTHEKHKTQPQLPWQTKCQQHAKQKKKNAMHSAPCIVIIKRTIQQPMMQRYTISNNHTALQERTTLPGCDSNHK